jgi:hypothetical protein
MHLGQSLNRDTKAIKIQQRDLRRMVDATEKSLCSNKPQLDASITLNRM